MTKQTETALATTVLHVGGLPCASESSERAVVEGVPAHRPDVVLMRSDPLDDAVAITISRGTLSKMHQNLAWAVG